ncbi:MAG: flagellar motor switch protein FliG [Francisellaceae bacterium]|jgi:flagellar motor switch protein FliG|nr:flagellar motor switch protein FliG [Francisellaceae bacterium]MBT6539681.1 flagellar motor switch protein FliG [Francisellaceae bacterium]
MNSNMAGLEKAAIFLMNLENSDAAEIIKYLTPKQIQKLGVAMSSLSNVDKSDVDSVIHEFVNDVGGQTSIGIDAQAHIKDVVVGALGEDKAKSVLDRILTGADTKGLDSFKWMEPKSIAEIIKVEHPQIQAIVLSYLDADQAAEVFSHMDGQRNRSELLMRISKLESVQPNAIKELNDIMEKEVMKSASGSAKYIGGTQCAANILNHLDTSLETDIIEDIKKHDPELSQDIQDLMFVFDNLLDVDDRGIQALLREVSTESLILALKGSDTAIKEKVFNNMSKRAAELLADDLEAKGPVKVSEVEQAQKEIIEIARRMEDAGEISLGGRGEAMI